MNLSSFSISTDGARYTVETPIQPTIPEDGLGRLAGGKKRQDTNFKFEVNTHDGVPGSTEALGGRKRNDTSFSFSVVADNDALDPIEALTGGKRKHTSFEFSIAADDDTLDSDGARGGKKRTDTSFNFEVVASEPAADPSDQDGAEALGSPKRKSASFHFERTATPTDGGLAMGEIREASGDDALPTETPTEAGKKRSDSAFSFSVVTPGGGFASVVVRTSAVAGE